MASHNSEPLTISTQVHGEVGGEGITDIELRADHRFVVLEVKDTASAYKAQISKYRDRIKNSAKPGDQVGVVLLTRFAVPADELKAMRGFFPETEQEKFFPFRWHDVADWITRESETIGNELSRFLVDQFLDLLKTRRMTVEEVTHHLTDGVLSLQSLLGMMERIAELRKPVFRMYRQYNGVGFYLNGKKYWWGLALDKPDQLEFLTHRAFRIDVDKAGALGKGELVEAKPWHIAWHIDGWIWKNSMALSTEKIHFFDRSKTSQMQCLEDFLKENIDLATKFEKAAVAAPTQ